jgi:hypothetical protein
MRIRVDIEEGAWELSRQEIEQYLRPTLATPGRRATTCHDLWIFGPDATVWFESGDRSVGYSGSVPYLSCHLRRWVRDQPSSFAIPSESVFQAPELRIAASGDTFELRFGRVGGFELMVVPAMEMRRAVREFVDWFIDSARERWPGLVESPTAFDWLD